MGRLIDIRSEGKKKTWNRMGYKISNCFISKRKRMRLEDERNNTQKKITHTNTQYIYILNIFRIEFYVIVSFHNKQFLFC